LFLLEELLPEDEEEEDEEELLLLLLLLLLLPLPLPLLLLPLDDEEEEEEESLPEDDEDEDEEESDEDSSARCLAASACICWANNFGAFFRCSLNPSVSPPNPMDVKKLMANRVFLGLSLGNMPENTSCMYGSLNRSLSIASPRTSDSS
jgi:hypothetical protein